MNSKIKFGIVGTGNIANIVANAMKETEARLVAVASRRIESANEFADKHGGLQVFESWNDLVVWPGLDAVYVATPTSAREDICITAAQSKKHVLAEKPFADLSSLEKITETCRERCCIYGCYSFCSPPAHQAAKKRT